MLAVRQVSNEEQHENVIASSLAVSSSWILFTLVRTCRGESHCVNLNYQFLLHSSNYLRLRLPIAAERFRYYYSLRAVNEFSVELIDFEHFTPRTKFTIDWRAFKPTTELSFTLFSRREKYRKAIWRKISENDKHNHSATHSDRRLRLGH